MLSADRMTVLSMWSPRVPCSARANNMSACRSKVNMAGCLRQQVQGGLDAATRRHHSSLNLPQCHSDAFLCPHRQPWVDRDGAGRVRRAELNCGRAATAIAVCGGSFRSSRSFRRRDCHTACIQRTWMRKRLHGPTALAAACSAIACPVRCCGQKAGHICQRL